MGSRGEGKTKDSHEVTKAQNYTKREKTLSTNKHELTRIKEQGRGVKGIFLWGEAKYKKPNKIILAMSTAGKR